MIKPLARISFRTLASGAHALRPLNPRHENWKAKDIENKTIRERYSNTLSYIGFRKKIIYPFLFINLFHFTDK